MATVTAIQGVDETLRQLSTDALAGQVPPVAVTLGPVDRPDNRARVNWFLYRVSPNPAYANMEPPATGWRTARGRPPLALRLHYLLTTFPAPFTTTGDEVQFAHRALSAVMLALHEGAIIGEGDPRLSPLASPLVEPLRIAPDECDLESITKLFTAATQPLRLSAGYTVSLVTIDPTESHTAGPPVLHRTVAVTPSMGPRLGATDPERLVAGAPFTVEALDVPPHAVLTVRREPHDPPGPTQGWPVTVVARTTTTLTLRIDAATPAPGQRILDVRTFEAGLPTGQDATGFTLAPAITGHAGTGQPNTDVDLTTTNVADDVEVFLGGVAVDPTDVTFLSPTHVRVMVPAGTPSGPLPASLRSRTTAGPVYDALAVP
jgi:hypothetical protein